MILDLSKKGLAVFGFKPHEAEALRVTWASEERIDSRTTWTRVRENGYPVSRATVINFLRRMAREGVLVEVMENQGRGGGDKGWYTPHPDYPDEEMFIKKQVNYVLKRLIEEFKVETGFRRHPVSGEITSIHYTNKKGE